MTFRVPDHIHARTVHDEVIILDTRTDGYLGLNPTGAAVWDVLANGRPITEAVDILVLHFDVPRDTAEQDVAILVRDLQRFGVLSPLTP